MNVYERTWEILQSCGYHQYEISNYAKKEECRAQPGILWTRKEYLSLVWEVHLCFKISVLLNLRDLRCVWGIQRKLNRSDGTRKQC